MQATFDEHAQWLVVKRGDIEVVCNFASEKQLIPLGRTPRGALSSIDKWDLRPGAIEIPADSVAILSAETIASMQEHFRQYASA